VPSRVLRAIFGATRSACLPLSHVVSSKPVDRASLASRTVLSRRSWLAKGTARAVALALVAQGVCAQSLPGESGAPSAASGAVARSGFMQVFERLDSLGVLLVVGAAIILVLLLLRIVMMVRGEKPVKVPEAARRRPTMRVMDDDVPLERTTTQQGRSDWGQDQNKRSAAARESIAVNTKADALPSLDQAVTQWTTSEVHNAAFESRQVGESMGKPPDMPASPYRTAFNPYYRGDQPNPAALEVIEVADTLMQAELLVQLGDPKQAMTLLANHIRETERPGPAVWLMLLDLYQSTGRKQQYEALASGFSTLFNAQVPPWATSKAVAARDLESYPQVMMKLHMSWDKPTVRPFVEGLLNDDRGGSRQGFSLAAYRDLLFLLELVTELEKMVQEEDEREDIQKKLQKAG
jgi:hypothetical protein